jgi:PST family polysaccharide transporter
MIISRQLGTTELGLYYLAAQLAFLPAEAASEVVGAVAFPLFARLQLDIRRVTQAFQIMVTGMSTLLFPVSALIIALAPSLITSLMSPQWAGAVPIMQILALVSMIGVFGEATVPVLYGLGQPYKVTMLESVQSFLIIVVAWGLTRRFDLVGAALAWLPAIVGSQLLSAMFMQRLLTRPLARLKSPLLAITAISGIGAAVAVGVTSVIPGLFGLVTASLLAMLVICALLWISDRRFELGLFENLGRAFPQLAILVGYTSVES